MRQPSIGLPWVSHFPNSYAGADVTPKVLHPGLKLEYFRQHDWEKEWIEQAETMVREEYAANYEKAVASEEMSVESSSALVCGIPLHSYSDSFNLI